VYYFSPLCKLPRQETGGVGYWEIADTKLVADSRFVRHEHVVEKAEIELE
jgi:hypothetical protein